MPQGRAQGLLCYTPRARTALLFGVHKPHVQLGHRGGTEGIRCHSPLWSADLNERLDIGQLVGGCVELSLSSSLARESFSGTLHSCSDPQALRSDIQYFGKEGHFVLVKEAALSPWEESCLFTGTLTHTFVSRSGRVPLMWGLTDYSMGPWTAPFKEGSMQKPPLWRGLVTAPR